MRKRLSVYSSRGLADHLGPNRGMRSGENRMIDLIINPRGLETSPRSRAGSSASSVEALV